jgi:hypothetical protein
LSQHIGVRYRIDFHSLIPLGKPSSIILSSVKAPITISYRSLYELAFCYVKVHYIFGLTKNDAIVAPVIVDLGVRELSISLSG